MLRVVCLCFWGSRTEELLLSCSGDAVGVSYGGKELAYLMLCGGGLLKFRYCSLSEKSSAASNCTCNLAPSCLAMFSAVVEGVGDVLVL